MMLSMRGTTRQSLLAVRGRLQMSERRRVETGCQKRKKPRAWQGFCVSVPTMN